MNSIDELLLAEATKVDFKVALEEKKPKSWFKSISACIMKNPNITRKEKKWQKSLDVLIVQLSDLLKA